MAILEERAGAICRRDPHVGGNGAYTVRSVYFDDYRNTCYRENEDGTNPREKYRIRIYNGDTGHIVLECKKKRDGKGCKDSCRLNYAQCRAMLDGTFSMSMLGGDGLREESRVLNRFFLQYTMRPLRAKTIVEYERKPYIYPAGNVRITFDRNISGSGRVREFLGGGLRMRPVMPPGQHIMEVKFDELIPDALHDALQLEGLRRTAYSKYFICRKFCG